MRILIAAAVFTSLALSPQARGAVSKISAGPADATGTVPFTVEGTNPCGAVHIDYGDGAAVTHPITQLPATIPHAYARVGDYAITARGMGNCDGAATTSVRVHRVKRPADPPPPPSPPATWTSVTTMVDSREDWINTGLEVRRGDLLDIDVTGAIQFADRSLPTGPDGAVGLRAPAGAPMPREWLGALVAKLRRSAPFLIGAGADRLRAPTDGPLYLRVNDDVLSDNRGEFRVVISVSRERR